MDRQNFKLTPNEKFISSKLLENLITETDINKAIVEEMNSELWFETLNGYGKVKFKNLVEYTGSLHYGILESESPDKPCTIVFPNGTSYTGTMKQNQITGEGVYKVPNGSTYTGQVLNGLRNVGKIVNKLKEIGYENVCRSAGESKKLDNSKVDIADPSGELEVAIQAKNYANFPNFFNIREECPDPRDFILIWKKAASAEGNSRGTVAVMDVEFFYKLLEIYHKYNVQ